ncbi:MAG: selenocysteine-specific translation elongation factor [Polyangiales bacterium]
MPVIGTAGHVDHGKTTLVRALTGVDTDRLPEEKRRGITIELGFAPMVVTHRGNTKTLAIVDVPGHERFVGTMVSGAQGVDVALLVVAADAGVMQQTREHLVVLEGLGIPALVVALTRCDLADEETRALARVDVEDVLAQTRWKGAPIHEVSGKTGDGIEALRQALADATQHVDLAERRARPARLAIDRAFVPRGQGVVVTGTLIDGTVAVGDELEQLPRGATLRVRGLHVHGKAVESVTATARVALSLAGAELADVRRGDVLAAAGTMVSMRAFDAVFTRPIGGRAFGRRARVSIHAGTDESPARLVPLGALEPKDAGSADPAGLTTIAGGERRLVRVVLAQPLAVAVSDRVVVRGDARLAGVGTTLGALEVLRVSPGRFLGGRGRYVETLRAIAAADATARARLEVEATGLSGLTQPGLVPRLARRSTTKDLLRALTPLEVRAGSVTRWVGAPARAKMRQALLDALKKFHAQHPDDEGAPQATVLSAAPANAAPGVAEQVLEACIAAAEIVRAGERLRLATHRQNARPDDPVALTLADRLDAAAMSPPVLQELAKDLSIDTGRARALATALATAGRVVHVQGDLWFSRPVLDDLRARLVARLQEKGSITTGEFKELVGASRKYVMPLAEWFDTQKVTLRVGDVRKLRQA